MPYFPIRCLYLGYSKECILFTTDASTFIILVFVRMRDELFLVFRWSVQVEMMDIFPDNAACQLLSLCDYQGQFHAWLLSFSFLHHFIFFLQWTANRLSDISSVILSKLYSKYCGYLYFCCADNGGWWRKRFPDKQTIHHLSFSRHEM